MNEILAILAVVIPLVVAVAYKLGFRVTSPKEDMGAGPFAELSKTEAEVKERVKEASKEGVDAETKTIPVDVVDQTSEEFWDDY